MLPRPAPLQREFSMLDSVVTGTLAFPPVPAAFAPSHRAPVSALQSLPCRGQRTKNNARTRKGKAKAIPGKKK